MAVKKIGKQSVFVIRRQRFDRLSDEDEIRETEREIKYCVVLPRWASGAQGNENDKGWTITEGHQILAPFGSDIMADDIVRLPFEPSKEWEVDGMPGLYVNKRGKGKMTMVFVKRVGT